MTSTSILLILLFSSGLFLIGSSMFCKAQVVTQVGGILWENTTWTAANSPYVITGTVQVPLNVTLTIEAGVTVTTSMNPSNEYLFLLNGKIC